MSKLRPPKNPPPVTTLLDDEAFLETWQPDFWTFLKRAILLGILSSTIFAPFSILHLPSLFALEGLNIFLAMLIFVALGLIFALIALFIFDDHTNWLRHRSDIWHLTSFRLIYENEDQPEQNATINLHDIDAVKRQPWRSLRVRLFNGQNVMMKYFASPKAVQKSILDAKAAIDGDSPQ